MNLKLGPSCCSLDFAFQTTLPFHPSQGFAVLVEVGAIDDGVDAAVEGSCKKQTINQPTRELKNAILKLSFVRLLAASVICAFNMFLL